MFKSYRDVVCVSKSTENKFEYNSHYSTCNICYAAYLSESEVEVHRRKVHKRELEQLFADKKNFLCFTCIKEFPDKEEVFKHTKRVHLLSSEDAFRIEREIFICDICNSIFFNKDMLIVHLMYTHYVHTKFKNKVWATCPLCFGPIRLQTIWSHFQKHQMQSVSCCKVCFAKCKNTNTLYEHLELHAPHLYCNICDYVTNDCHTFKSHITQKHRNKIDGRRVIDFKRYFVKNVTNRYKGIRWKFENQCAWRGVKNLNGLNVCVLCREICNDDSSMNLHIVRDHMTQIQAPQEVKKYRYMCSCGGEFFNNLLLKRHILITEGAHRVLEQHEIPETSKTQDSKKRFCLQ